MQLPTTSLLSPRYIVVFFLSVSIALMSLVGYLALQPKVIGHIFLAEGEHLLLLNREDKSTVVVREIGATSTTMQAVSALDIMEEPDVLPTYAEYNRFIDRQSELSGQLAGETVFIRFADGVSREFSLRERTFADLRFGFYLQLFAGLLCVVIGSAIWAFNIRRMESQVYLLMGLSVALSCWSSAIYTTRELAIDGELFRILSLVNHLGAAGFGGGLLGLFAMYPRPVIKPVIAWMLTLSFVPVWLADTLQLTTDIASAFHLPLLVYVLVAFGLAFVQWRATRAMPTERAVLKWLLLSVMGTTMIFTVMNIIPAAFMATTLGSQAFTLTGFALGFVMMALGLSRYKLFNLDRWWFQYWTWFFAGIAILVLDWLLLSLLDFGVEPTLGIAIALVGWLYIPVRQKVWDWVSPDAEASLQVLLPDIVNILFAARNKADVHQAWRIILEHAFAPLSMSSCELSEQMSGRPQLAEYGQTLRVPSLANESAWELSHPANGSRLFSQQDIELANMMLELVVKAFNAIQAREEGVMAERDRIKRDLHDDLGARMLSVLHSTTIDQSQIQARQAMTELRSILNALEQSPCSLEEAFDVWQAEFQERILQADFSLDWQQFFKGTALLSARARHNIGRVLRELISNALRHSGGNTISIKIEFVDTHLQITVADNGTGFDPAVTASGLGKKIVQSRIHELGGSVTWQLTGQGACLVSIGLLI